MFYIWKNNGIYDNIPILHIFPEESQAINFSKVICNTPNKEIYQVQ